MNICIVSHEFEPFPGGGIATYHNAAAKAFAAAGHEVHLVTNAALHGSADPRHAKRIHRRGNLVVHRLPHFDESRRVADDFEMFGAKPSAYPPRAAAWVSDASHVAALDAASYVRRLHADRGLDVIESPEYFAEAFYMVRARHAGHTDAFPPICIHGHVSSRIAFRTNGHYWDLGYPPHRQQMAREEYCLQLADALLTPSRSLMSRYESDFGGALPTLRAVVPYFLDLEVDAAGALPAELRDGGPFLLCVGRIEPRKGSDIAVRAFAELARRHPRLRLVFLGREVWHQGETFEQVLRDELDEEARSRVLRLGNVPRSQVLAAMAAAAAFLHPAPWDNYPCATLEALGVGALCVVSDNGGQAEMVEDGVSGYLHRADDPDSLARAIDAALRDAPRCAAVREAARRRARAITDPASLIRQRMELFDAMVARGDSRSPKAGASGPRRPDAVAPDLIVIDAAGEPVEAFEQTREALGNVAGARVVVILDPQTDIALPAGWTRVSTADPMVWHRDAAPSTVAWLLAGARPAREALQECTALVHRSPEPCGAYAWMVPELSSAFPFGPDFGLHDLMLEGRPLPAGLVVSTSALAACRSLAGIPSARQRLATVLASAAATGVRWFRHTPGVAGRFAGELPVVDIEIQNRVLGYLDAIGALAANATVSGALDRLSSPVPTRRAASAPAWIPKPGVVPNAPSPLAIESVSIGRRTEIDGAPPSLTWQLDADNWFDVVPAARQCAQTDRGLDFALASGERALMQLGDADLTAVYQCIRDWWPWLSGAERPKSLDGEAYNRLTAQLRTALMEHADHRLRGEAPAGIEPTLPPVEHELLTDDAGALRVWRAFLAGEPTAAFRRYLDALAARDDVDSLAATHAWVRVLLLHRLWSGWDARVHAILARLYAGAEQRTALREAEAGACEAAGLDWWLKSVSDDLAVESAWQRRPPFALPRAAVTTKAAAPLVTVIVPSFRHERYVRTAIRSVLRQTLSDVRVLVVDDRSPDGTVAAARRVRDPRVEVRENTENLGLGNSVLQALRDVDTPFVAILNSDDVFHPRRLEVCVDVLQRDAEADLVATGLSLIDRAGREIDERNVSAWYDGRNVRDWVRWFAGVQPTADERDGLFRKLLRRNFLITSSNLVCRTDWLRSRDDALSGLKYCLDWQLFLDAALHGRLRHVEEPLLAYRLHPANTVWFGRSARWAYTLEVNRVAAGAVRAHLEQYPPGSEQGLTETMRDVVGALHRNTESDWLGMFVNDLVGGARLDAAARMPGGPSEQLSRLPELAIPRGAVDEAATRAAAQESRARVLADEVEVLQARHRWQIGRLGELEVQFARIGPLEAQASRVGGLEADVAAARAEVNKTGATLGETQQQLAAVAAREQTLTKELAAAQARLDTLTREHESLGATHRWLQAGLDTQRTMVAALQAELDALHRSHALAIDARESIAAALAAAQHAAEREARAAREPRLRPKTGSRDLLRRVATKMRLVSALPLAQADATAILVAEPGTDARPWTGDSQFAGGTLRVAMVDATAPFDPAAGAPILFDPQRGPRRLRRLVGEDRVQAETSRAHAVARELGLAGDAVVGEAAELAHQLAVRPRAMLVSVGSWQWHARAHLAALFARRRWLAFVDSVPIDAPPEPFAPLRDADLVVARSTAIAAALAAGGVPSDRLEVLLPGAMPGVFASPATGPHIVAAFGGLESMRPWDRCLRGVLDAAARIPSMRLRVVARWRNREPHERATALALRAVAAAAAERVEVTIVDETADGDWRSRMFPQRVAALLWVDTEGSDVHGPDAVVVSALAERVPVVAWSTIASRDLRDLASGSSISCVESAVGVVKALDEILAGRLPSHGVPDADPHRDRSLARISAMIAQPSSR